MNTKNRLNTSVTLPAYGTATQEVFKACGSRQTQGEWSAKCFSWEWTFLPALLVSFVAVEAAELRLDFNSETTGLGHDHVFIEGSTNVVLSHAQNRLEIERIPGSTEPSHASLIPLVAVIPPFTIDLRTAWLNGQSDKVRGGIQIYNESTFSTIFLYSGTHSYARSKETVGGSLRISPVNSMAEFQFRGDGVSTLGLVRARTAPGPILLVESTSNNGLRDPVYCELFFDVDPGVTGPCRVAFDDLVIRAESIKFPLAPVLPISKDGDMIIASASTEPGYIYRFLKWQDFDFASTAQWFPIGMPVSGVSDGELRIQVAPTGSRAIFQVLKIPRP